MAKEHIESIVVVLFPYCLLCISLLWETLTGREHLLFYGRLKNLKGSDLIQVCYQSYLSRLCVTTKVIKISDSGIINRSLILIFLSLGCGRVS